MYNFVKLANDSNIFSKHRKKLKYLAK